LYWSGCVKSFPHKRKYNKVIPLAIDKDFNGEAYGFHPDWVERKTRLVELKVPGFLLVWLPAPEFGATSEAREKLQARAILGCSRQLGN
jgi:S-formylglutathione hydrolase FrmB